MPNKIFLLYHDYADLNGRELQLLQERFGSRLAFTRHDPLTKDQLFRLRQVYRPAAMLAPRGRTLPFAVHWVATPRDPDQPPCPLLAFLYDGIEKGRLVDYGPTPARWLRPAA